MSDLQRIHIVRHGETSWSLSGRHTGRTEVTLTESGEHDARGLAVLLGGVVFARVFSSPRVRARRTCELAGLGAMAEIDADLAEWDYGDFEGLRSPEIHERAPNWNVFSDGCPGGESPGAVSDRADRLIARLRGFGGNIAVFTHGHFGRVLAARWIGLPVAQARGFFMSTASVGILGHEHHDANESVIEQWNAKASGRES